MGPGLPPDILRLGPRLARHWDFVYLLLAAGTFRLFAVALLSVGGLFPHVQDYRYYRDFAQLSLEGYYPFVHYWLEYPPLFGWLAVGIFKLAVLLPPLGRDIFWFQALFGLFLALVDSGNIALLYLIGLRLHGRAIALRVTFLYALLFAPVYVMLVWSDSFPVLTILLALYLLLAGRTGLAGVVTGMGFMVKVFPILMAPVGLITLSDWRSRLRFLAAVAATATTVAFPFMLIAPHFLLAFFQSMAARGSWETVWAVLEGYYGMGEIAPISDHLEASSALWSNHEQRVPWLLVQGVFGASLALLVPFRRWWRTPLGTVALAGTAILLTMVFSKGYSPQFIVYSIPFILLLLPNGWGLAYTLLLTALNVLQYPIDDVLLAGRPRALPLLVSSRTFVWAALVLEFLALVSPVIAARWDRLRPGLASVLVLVAIANGTQVFSSVLHTYRDDTQYARAVKVIAERGGERVAVVYSNPESFYYGHPLLRDADYLVVPQDWSKREDTVQGRLADFLVRHREVWVFLNYRQSDFARVGFVESTLRQYATPTFDQWFQDFRLVHFVRVDPAGQSTPMEASGAQFGDKLLLEAYSPIPHAISPPGTIRILTRWQLTSPLEKDLKLFVHMAGPDLRPIRQTDKVLRSAGDAHGAVGPDSVFFDVADVFLDPSTPPGDYVLLLGVYEAPDGPRLMVNSAQGDYLELGRITVQALPPSGETRHGPE